MELLSRVEEEYDRVNIHDIQVEKKPLNYLLRQELFQELSDKDFVHASLRKLLQEEYYITMSIGNIQLNYIPIPSIRKSHMTKIVKRLLITYKILSISSPIHIWLLPCKEKRKFPQYSQEISPKHINGGYTYLHDHSIFIYRYEEFPKVLLHELIHNSKINSSWEISDIDTLYKLFNIDTRGCPYVCKTQLEPNEAIVEAWAIQFHCMFLSIENNLSFEQLLKEELEWSIYLTKRIHRYQSIVYPQWRESTHSYSYIVLKTILLLHRNEFLKKRIPYSSKVLSNFFKKYQEIPEPSYIYQVPKGFEKSMRMTRYGDL